ncbi:hypothetical protein LI328DRAFT_171364 [Trichoderma asperelloides]|nr:hypothetical protein LI328DRAFT_171364 [Trichoderma asperelloides]
MREIGPLAMIITRDFSAGNNGLSRLIFRSRQAVFRVRYAKLTRLSNPILQHIGMYTATRVCSRLSREYSISWAASIGVCIYTVVQAELLVRHLTPRTTSQRA